MQTAISIVLSVLIGVMPLWVTWQVWRSAGTLGFSAGKRQTVTAITLIALAGWLAFVVWGGLNGFFQQGILIRRVPLPNLTYLSIGPVIVGTLLMAASATVRQIIDSWKPERIMLVETTRLIGGVFLILYFTKDLPGIFALPAGIGDVIIGLTAPIMAWLVATRGDQVRGLAIGWNIVGILELVDALTFGFLTFGLRAFVGAYPSPFGTVTLFPLVLIPAYGVPMTILAHIAALRRLQRRTEAGAPAPAGVTV